jgi:hypothetical protein
VDQADGAQGAGARREVQIVVVALNDVGGEVVCVIPAIVLRTTPLPALQPVHLSRVRVPDVVVLDVRQPSTVFQQLITDVTEEREELL